MEQKVLIVEDDRRLADMLSLHLGRLGLQTEHASDGQSGLGLAVRRGYDLIILDLNLPDIDGLEVCRRVRAVDRETRILMLTALCDELDLIVGLETGADDYVGKPFKVGELMARVQALLRRTTRSDEPGAAGGGRRENRIERTFRDLRINIERRKIYRCGAEVELTAREYDLLIFLSSTPGRAYTRRQILQNVWGCEVMGYDHSINTIIKRLRKKIECDPKNPSYIETVRGVGYRFSDAA